MEMALCDVNELAEMALRDVVLDRLKVKTI